MKKLRKLAFVLAVLTVLSLLAPMSAFAADTTVVNSDRIGYSVENVVKVTVPALTAENDLGKMTVVDTDGNVTLPAALSSAGTFYISDAQGLVNLARLTNAGNGFSGFTFIQTAPIDLKDVTAWTPIGYNAASQVKNPFQGTYDGQGYAISNMKYSCTSSANVVACGLLIGCAKGATVLNAVLDGTCALSYDYASPSGKDVRLGAIAGFATGEAVTVSNCYTAATVTNTKAVKAGPTAGILGQAEVDGTTVQYCTNAGAVTGAKRVAGIVAYVGNKNTVMKGCMNTGTVHLTSAGTGDFTLTAAGICASPNHNAASSSTIDSCVNYGLIISDGSPYVAGIVGCIRNNAKVSGCTDYGTVQIANTAAPTTVYGKTFSSTDGIAGVADTNRVLRSVGKAEYHGYQIKENAANDKAVDIRFVGSIDSVAYSAVGMDITVTFTYEGKTVVKALDYKTVAGCTTTTVYNTLLAMTGENQTETFSAATLREDGSGYLFAVVLTGIPKAAGDLTVTVVPLCMDAADSTIVYRGMPVSSIIDTAGGLPGSMVPDAPSA